MFEVLHSVEELLHGDTLIAKVLHVYFAVSLVHQIDTWRCHSQTTHTLHTLGLLQHPGLGHFVVESWHAVLLLESFLDDAAHPKQFGQKAASLSTLAH